jgi:hypothetical protein
LAGERDEASRRLVIRNGHHRERTVTTAAGPIAVKAPRVNDKRVDGETGERRRFSSKILAPWCRKSPKISEVLPLLYLHGLSSGDFVPAMEQFLGSAAGLSPATVTRLTKQWSDDHAAFQDRDLSGSDYVYVWADGVHPKVRLGQARSCVLVLMGVRTDGSKELIALAEGPARVDRVLGRPPAGLPPARHARSRARRRRRSHGAVAGPGRGVSAGQTSKVLGSQNPERGQRPAEIGPARREEGDAGDL